MIEQIEIEKMDIEVENTAEYYFDINELQDNNVGNKSSDIEKNLLNDDQIIMLLLDLAK